MYAGPSSGSLEHMATKRRLGSLLAATIVLLPLGVSSAYAATPGAEDLGDRLFPGLGNGGYDAQSYDVSLGYQVGTTKMPGVVTMRAVATQDLSRFGLDSVGQQIASVTVDGQPAKYTQAGEKLTITPAHAIHRRPFTV